MGSQSPLPRFPHSSRVDPAAGPAPPPFTGRPQRAGAVVLIATTQRLFNEVDALKVAAWGVGGGGIEGVGRPWCILPRENWGGGGKIRSERDPRDISNPDPRPKACRGGGGGGQFPQRDGVWGV